MHTGRPQGPPLQTMKDDLGRPQRRSIRLPGYDYSQPGAYYFTICIQSYECLLGDVVLGQMEQNDAGEMVDRTWNSIPQQFPMTTLDEHIVMPNHFRGIIKIVGAPLLGARKGNHRGQRAAIGAAPTKPPGVPALGEMVGAFKSITTDKYIRGVREQGWPKFNEKLWQRDFYDHIIRDELELERIRNYIRRNPQMWAIDRCNPGRTVPVIDEEGRVVPWEEP